MLKIRHDQVEALGRASFERFVASEVERLSAENHNVNETQVDDNWIRENIETGKTYGMYTEEEHSRFNDLKLESGPDFPNAEDLEVLHQNHLEGWQKLDELQGRIALASI
jgi:hypothetical protein